MKHLIILFTAFLLGFQLGQGQEKLHWNEKVYGHTDRPLYFPGETIWFKAYITGIDEKASHLSEILIAELISPKGTVIETKNYSISDGGSYGEFEIANDWVGGRYKLRLYTNYQKNFGQEVYYTKELVVQKVVLPKLLMNLKFHKEAYGQGSLVNAEFKLKDLENVPLQDYGVKASLLISGKHFESQEFKTNSQGIGLLRFALPPDLKTSDVVLTALVPYKGTTESVSRSVPVILDNIDLQFLPEGGKMLASLPSTIAFKALNEFGKPADVRGVILNQAHEEVGRFDSYHDGMGTFQLKADPEQRYFARIEQPFLSDSLYRLPLATKQGAKVHLRQKTTGQLVVETQSLEAFNGELLVLDAGQVERYRQPLSFQGRVATTIDTQNFPAGIAKLQLLDQTGQIHSERLVFIDRVGMQVELKLNKTTFGTRDLVELEILTKDASNKPISGNVSVAVVDNTLLSFADDKQDHIKSYLLMSSELQGKIHKPSFYFDETELKASKARDLLMLTQGWRSYATQGLKQLPHKVEYGSIITGYTADRRGNRVEAHLYLFEDEMDSRRVVKTKTDPQGNFSFKVPPNRNYVLIAFREDDKFVEVKEGKITNINALRKRVKAEAQRQINSQSRVQDPKAFNKKEGAQRKEVTIAKKAKVELSLEEDAQQLQEVVVVGYGVSQLKQALGYHLTVKGNELSQSSNTSLVETFSGQVAGLQVTTGAGQPGAGTAIRIRGLSSFRGNAQPLFIIDGVPITDGLNGNGNGELRNLDPSSIESVNVLKGLAATSIYGNRGANGVILISTKNINYNYWNWRSFGQKRFRNYTMDYFRSRSPRFGAAFPAQFYRPSYKGVESHEQRNDFRRTIFWNPVVQTDLEGQAKLSFYTSDAVTSFHVDVQGISTKGTLGKSEKDFSTVRPLSVTTKIPPYLSVGDTVSLPLTISNSGEKALWVKPKMFLSKKMKQMGANLPDSLLVEAKGFKTWPLEIRADSVSNEHLLEFEVRGENAVDGIFHNMVTVSPHFPARTSLSGMRSQSFTFNRTAVVPKSTGVEGKIYLNIAAEVMEGAESLLRMPSGCFEQTSSANFPNVLILQYLEETKSFNPQLKKRANRYLRRGYQKLGSFEVKGGGFSWFGSTPASSRLTAYGLLQLNEMKKVYPKVDTALIGRSTRWLLAQKDRDGGFHKGQKWNRYHNWDIYNAYIVYCLSELGLDHDIDLQYKTALKEAYTSKDVYRMALLALASHNKGEHVEYERLTALLLEQVRTVGFAGLGSEGTVTRSYWTSRKLETTALIALALLKTNESKQEIAQAFEYIISKRYRGRFGSTQSTALCLKALLEYARVQKASLPKNLGKAIITVNGQRQVYPLGWKSKGVIELIGLEELLGEGEQQVEVKFTNTEVQLPYSLNIHWESSLPKSAKENPIGLSTSLEQKTARVGDVVRMNVEVNNRLSEETGMVTAMIGIPSGLSVQPYQLKELLEQKQVDYYEVMDNLLILYWISCDADQSKKVMLDLKAEFAGSFTGSASAAYLYYGDEYKSWVKGCQIKITP